MGNSENIRGAQIMTLTMLAFAVSDLTVKLLLKDIPIFQMFFMRGILVFAGLLAIIALTSAKRPRTNKEWLMLFARGLCECLVAYLFFIALPHISLTDVTTILQLLPLIMTVAAFLIFGEKFGIARFLAIIVGFIGVWLVVRPSFTDLNINYIYAFGSMLMVAIRDLITRALPKDTSNFWATAVLAFCVMAMGLIGLFWTKEWHPMAANSGLLLLASASFIIVGYLASVKAMRIGDVSFVGGFRYMGILFAIIADVIIFADFPDYITLIGCFLIAGAGIFTIYRERVAKRA